MEHFSKNLEMESAISDIAPFLGMGIGAEILYTLGQMAYERFSKGHCPRCRNGCDECNGTGTAKGYEETRSAKESSI